MSTVCVVSLFAIVSSYYFEAANGSLVGNGYAKRQCPPLVCDLPFLSSLAKKPEFRRPYIGRVLQFPGGPLIRALAAYSRRKELESRTSLRWH